MILSNVEIHRAIDEGRLTISPEPLPRFQSPGQICPYDTHTVDLRLRSEIRIPSAASYSFDLSQPGLIGFLEKNSERIEITESRPYVLDPHKFILGITLEKVSLPINVPINVQRNACLSARIEGKSSRARCGVLVHFTAPTIHPDWEGQLALEIINLGPVAFTLRLGMPIAQLIVEEVKGIPLKNPSQFQGQKSPAGQ